MYRCATVTVAELEALRRITNVIRKGHVVEITDNRIELEAGHVETSPDVLHIDCTADGLARRPMVPVFNSHQITLQAVSTCQQVFSAALIAHAEVMIAEEADKNLLCQPVPHPDADTDWIRVTLGTAINRSQRSRNAELRNWLAYARLDSFSHPPESGGAPPPISEEAIAEEQQWITKLQTLLAEVESQSE